MRRLPLALGFAIFLISSGCDSGTTQEGAAGTYRAERFAVTEGGATGDFLAAGGTFEMVLGDDGRFSADLDVPDVPELAGDQAFAATFDGTYTVRGEAVVFFHTEDLFVRDVAWTLDRRSIRTTDSVAGGTQFDIVLERE